MNKNSLMLFDKTKAYMFGPNPELLLIKWKGQSFTFEADWQQNAVKVQKDNIL